MTPTSIHSTCTCRFFHQGQCSCPDVTLFVIDDDSHAAALSACNRTGRA